ncbi:hypothetical protein FSP39_011719 [Pinctada imbricata]|uniref:G-protein coupled receptors family 1 profile domain-containing protein n=1 Tax=Pinctada imbricata TaxID=66713 RepID=A0AA88XXS7_PINIB|nr:hypothetical protein FSP39_011719 [Pinctada imbricata]
MKSRRWCTAGKSHKILIIVWAMSLLLSSPPLYIMNTEETRYYNNVTSVTLMFCSDITVNEAGKKAFFVYKILVMFALPTLVMSVCYTGVIYTLWISSRQLTQLTSLPSTSTSLEKVFLRTKNIAGNIPCSSESPFRTRNRSPQARCRNKSTDVLKARRQVIKILIAVVVVFLICWGPPLIMDAVLKFSPELGFSNTAFYIRTSLGCLPYLQSCMNPFIYCFMSKKFRKSVFSICRSRHCLCGALICSRNRHHASVVTFEMDSKLSNGTTQTRATVRNSQSASSDENTCLHSASAKCPS